MERIITISYNWQRLDEEEIKKSHIEALEECAVNRIAEQIKEGYTGGQLSDNIRMSDEDGEDGIEYEGWWNMTTENA